MFNNILYIRQMNRNDLGHDDSTINIVVVITISIITSYYSGTLVTLNRHIKLLFGLLHVYIGIRVYFLHRG